MLESFFYIKDSLQTCFKMIKIKNANLALKLGLVG